MLSTYCIGLRRPWEVYTIEKKSILHVVDLEIIITVTYAMESTCISSTNVTIKKMCENQF